MPRYVRTINIAIACQFDGSAGSALACVKAIGKPLNLTFDGDTPVLSLTFGKLTHTVEPGEFVMREGDRVSAQAANYFAENFARIDGGECANPSPPPVPVAVMSVDEAFEHGRRLAKRMGIEEGDFIHDRRLADSKEPDLEFEVMEWNEEGQVFVVDGPYGENRIPLDAAVFVRKAG